MKSFMDYFHNQNKNYGYYDQPTHPTGQMMATAALILGVAAISTCWTFYLPIALGCLGIVLALLSKGFERKLSGSAKMGILLSISGIVVSFVITMASTLYLIHNPDILLDFGRQTDLMTQQIYGQSSESLFGYSYEDMMLHFIDTFLK